MTPKQVLEFAKKNNCVMVDLKLVALYAGTFRRGFARTVVLVSAVATFVGALWVGVASG